MFMLCGWECRDPSELSFPSFMLPKLNGVRGKYLRKQKAFTSRKPKLWNPDVLRHIQPVLDAVDDIPFDLDGEFYVHGWPLSEINGAIGVNRIHPREDSHLVEYHVFDCDISDIGFQDRHDFYTSFVKSLGHPMIKAVEGRWVHNIQEQEEVYNEYVRLGFEGAIYRIGDTGYIQDRTEVLCRRKNFKIEEFLITDVYEGKETDKGSRLLGTLGGFSCTTLEGNCFNVGSGFSDEERAFFWENPPIGKWCSVRYLEMTKHRVPFNGTFIEVRDFNDSLFYRNQSQLISRKVFKSLGVDPSTIPYFKRMS